MDSNTIHDPNDSCATHWQILDSNHFKDDSVWLGHDNDVYGKQQSSQLILDMTIEVNKRSNWIHTIKTTKFYICISTINIYHQKIERYSYLAFCLLLLASLLCWLRGRSSWTWLGSTHETNQDISVSSGHAQPPAAQPRPSSGPCRAQPVGLILSGPPAQLPPLLALSCAPFREDTRNLPKQPSWQAKHPA